MKNKITSIVIIVSIIASLFTAIPSTAAEYDNYIQDGSFEKAGEQSITEIGASSKPWYSWVAESNVKGNSTIVKDDVNSGSFAGLSSYGATISQLISGLRPNSEYILTAYINIKKSGATLMVRGIGNTQSIVIDRDENKNQYVKYTMNVVTGENLINPEILFFSNMGGEAFIDDITLVSISSDVAGERLKKAINRLYAFGFLEEPEYESDKLNSYVTEYELEKITAKMRNTESIIKEKNELIVYQDAVKLIIDMLGYGEYVKNVWGNQAGYITQATHLGVLDNVSAKADENLKFSDMIIMLDNSLSVNIMKITSFGTEAKYEVDENNTLLKEYFNISKITGIVTGNNYTMLNNSSSLPENSVMIDQTVCRVGETNAGEYLGYKVTAYIEDDEDLDVKTVKYIIPSDDNRVMQIKADNIIGLNASFDFQYYDEYNNDKIKNVNVAKLANIIYNGRYSFTKAYNTDVSKLTPKAGNVTLIDADSNGEFETVMVNDVSYYVVNYAHTTNKQIFTKYDAGVVDVSENSGHEVIVTKNGSVVTLDQIREWDVIGVASSKFSNDDNREPLVKVSVFDGTVNGKIESISDEGITIKGVLYKYSAFLSAAAKNELMPENEATYCLDGDKKIIAAKNMVENDIMGYIVSAKPVGTLEKNLRMKIFNASGELKVYDCAEKITLNDIGGQTQDTVLSSLSYNNELVQQLITFSTNTVGMINEINTPENTKVTNGTLDVLEPRIIVEDDAPLTLCYYGGNDAWTYKRGARMFAGNNAGTLIDDETPVFIIPSNAESQSQKKFSISSAANLGNDVSFKNVYAYNVSKVGVPKAYVIVSQSAGGGSYTFDYYGTHQAVVTKVVQGMDADGNEGILVSYSRSDGKTFESLINEDVATYALDNETAGGVNLPAEDLNLSIGDVIHVEYDAQNNPIVLLKTWPRYDVQNKVMLKHAQDFLWSGPRIYTNEMSFGYVTHNTQTAMRVLSTHYNAGCPTDITKVIPYFYGFGGIDVYIVDFADNNAKVTKGSTKDLISGALVGSPDYNHSADGNKGDYVFIKGRNQEVQLVVVYRNLPKSSR